MQLGIRQRYVQPIKNGANEVVTKGRFEIDVLKARDNVGLVGSTMSWDPSKKEDGIDFVTLCTMACPSIDWSR